MLVFVGKVERFPLYLNTSERINLIPTTLEINNVFMWKQIGTFSTISYTIPVLVSDTPNMKV